MSGNQKQAPSGAPQQQRYAQGPTFAQRAPTPQRSDGFHVATTPTGFVPQQTSNQPTNQGPTIRGMAQSGPPNQASTPPQNDINKMQPPQPGQLQMFLPQQVRSAQNNYYRQSAPNPGGPRMSNHHRQTMTSTATAAQPMYSAQHMAIYQTGPMTPMTTYPMPIQYNTAQRPYYAAQAYPTMIPNQYIQSTFPPQQAHAQQYYFPATTQMQMATRQGPPPQVPSAPQGGAQPVQQTMPMQPAMPQPSKKKPRSNALPIINPQSGKDIFDEEEMRPPSGESSARDTPQPPSATSVQQQISAEFAARVAIRASEDKDPVETDSVHSIPVQTVTFQSSVPPPHLSAGPHVHASMGGSLKENDVHHKTVDSSLVQNSKLQASTKEFVPEITKQHAPKETTPVVSANTEGVEVMLPNKSRERESPAKTRRQQQQQQRETTPKEAPVVEVAPAPVKETPVPVAPAVQLAPEPEVKVSKAAAPAIPKVRSPNDTKGPVVVEHRPPIPSQPIPAAEDVACNLSNAKNKGGSQKSKENTASNQVQPSSKPAMPVPGTQPPKQSSKTNKLRDLNLKGASKEGTDMDAFNTGAAEAPPTENCNNEPAPKDEVVEAPAQPQPQPVQQLPPPQPQQQQPPQQQPPPQKLADVKTMPKPKVDVTSIVKEVPRPLKPQVPQQPVQQPPTTDSQDETDRAACEKLVQVKNETNISKTNSTENSDTQVIDKTVIRYKKDQWSPLNMEGKKCYDRDFLFSLQCNPKCKKKPENLPDLEIVLKDNNSRSRMDPRSFALNRPSEVLMPAFHKSSSQRGPLPKRNSQQGKAGIKGGKPNTIHVTLSLREDVKLRETENAWRPARLNSAQAVSEDELKTADLYKKVRGVLNKLTPEKFEKLLNQVRALSIDNEERLQGVIDLVFEKAVDEPNFSVAYALMCKELALMQVPSNAKANNKEEPQYVNFRKLLITRCQIEFEKNSVDENARNLKLKEIEECTDPEKKKELQLILEEDDRRMRVKSVGNIRFIGELFKQQMLTVKIMIRCINILLENKDEDSLECLCKLLTTVGKDLELSKNQNLNTYFNMMQEIVDKKHGKISSRVRFMLQDVIDLRTSKWVPRRQDLNPKTMEQIQKEADTEQLNIQVMNSGPMSTPRKDDRMGNPGGSDRKRRNNQTDDSGWSMAGPRNRTTYTVESSKLMNKPPPMEEIQLGSKNLFGNWGRGSNMKTQPTHAPAIMNTTNMYAALENIAPDQDKSRSAYESRLNKDPYVSKGHSMERTGYNKNYEDGRGSRSGSQHRNAPQQQKPVITPAPAPAPAAPVKQQLNPEQLKLRMQNIMEEYLNDCCTLKECESDIKVSIDQSSLQEFVIEGYNGVLERSASTRRKAGKLFAYLAKSQVLSNEELCKALREVLSQADDLVIDIPKLWDYLAEMILPLVTEGAVTLEKLRACSDILVSQGHAHKLLAQVLKQLVAENGPNYVVELWQLAGVQFTDFMPADIVDNYVKENKLDFLLGGAGTPVNQGSQSWDQVHSKLLQFFSSNTSCDNITDWINANVGSRVKENQFIRTLVTAVVENAVSNSSNVLKLKCDVLKQHYPLLQRYVDNQERLELQCLFALQALVHKWEHPPGLLLSIFERFWDDGLLSNDSFLSWEKCADPAEQEGKGVALKSIQSLFTSLKEADDESGSSTSDEA